MFGKLVVFLIVVFAIAVTIPQTRQMLANEAAPYINKYKAKIVPKRLDVMIDQLVVKVNRGEPLPSGKSAWGWLHRDYSSDPEDPWGHPYYIDATRGGFIVGSMGPDGIKGTQDDIRREHRFKR